MIIKSIAPGFFVVDHLFDEFQLAQLVGVYETQPTNTIPCITIASRKAWHLDTDKFDLIDYITSVVQNKTSRKIFPNISTFQLWEDPPGYINTIHKDLSSDMDINIQIYLDNDPSNIGTCAFIDQEMFGPVPYVKNCGYILFEPHFISHGMIKKVPQGVTRRSLYLSWRYNETGKDYV